MKAVVVLMSFCLILPLAVANGGKVKTVDGKQMPKDSVAVLYLTEQIGKRFADSILFVYAVKIDTITVSEMLYGVKDDYSILENPNTNPDVWTVDKAFHEFSETRRLRKVHLHPSGHILMLRCVARFKDRIIFTTPFLLTADVVAKHSYHLRIRYVEPIWHITIEDETAKNTVASIDVTSK